MSALPVDVLLPRLRAVLERPCNAVLQAPPGAGKTTRVPLALLGADWVGDRKVIMLEPRRIAARAAARFMARSLGEAVGATVGYRVRLDSRVGPDTRVEVVTEGILTRMLQDDPGLERVAAVIFDEFHERSLHADLALALCLDVQGSLREDLRLVVMSATLDGVPVAAMLDNAPVLASEGRGHPVRIVHAPLTVPRGHRAFIEQAAGVVRRAVREEPGSALVFLPGVGEIRRMSEALDTAGLPPDITVTPLHGQLDGAAQDRAIAPAPPGTRKVVLATSIAESSLTIDGVRIVVDAGLQRRPRFDPATGLSGLRTQTVSRASADQRGGRAGRTEPGVCYRLWPEGQPLQAQSPPEILEADLAPLVLELARWGVGDAGSLRWLDEPPRAHLAQAAALLQRLGALDGAGRITRHGADMLRLGAHPRLAHMMLRGHELGLGALACRLAALVEEGDPLRGTGTEDAGVAARLALLRDGRRTGRRGVERLRSAAARWCRTLGCPANAGADGETEMAGVLLAFAYPDRIARRRAGTPGRFLLSGGRGAVLADADPLGTETWLVAAHLDDAREARIRLAAPVTVEGLLAHHGHLVERRDAVEWDDGEGAVQALRLERIGRVTVRESPWEGAAPEAVRDALLEGIRRRGLGCLPWDRGSEELRARMAFLHGLAPSEWPDVSDEALLASLDGWLGPYLEGMRRLAHLRRLDLKTLLLARVPWDGRGRLDELAPTHVTVPSGSRVRIDYGQEIPVLAVRLQEMFGLTETPRVGGGRVPLLLHLLSPARRPMQVTRDLSAFWAGAYRDVRKELRGRYPKHHWPEDPLSATPTAGTRRRPRRP